jgi:hypothetical protein
VQAQQFKNRADLQTFAAKHPGAFTGMFLNMVHMRFNKGMIRQSKELRQVLVGTWASTLSGVWELRDQKEICDLGAVMDCINADDLSMAMDILAQRIEAIRVAKSGKTGNWDKANGIELVANPTDSSVGLPLRRLIQWSDADRTDIGGCQR